MSGQRALSLHESALSPVEYNVYIPLFDDLIDADALVDNAPNVDTHHPKHSARPGAANPNPNASIVVPVREARGWLKGRYPGVESGLVDKILRIFHPALSSADMLSQSQFFAALRLLAHSHSGTIATPGKELDPIFVFIQPPDASSSSVAHSSLSIGPASNATTPGVNGRNSNNPFNNRSNTSTPAKPSNPPPTTNQAPTGRPFSNSISNSASALSSDEGSVPDFVNSGVYGQVHGRAQSSPAPPAPNPFLARTNSIPQSAVVGVGAGIGVAPAQDLGVSKPTSVAAPPALPPRKPSFLPPPRHASQQPSGSVGSSTTVPPAKEPPAKPPKPAMYAATPAVNAPGPVVPSSSTSAPGLLPGHVTSPLIKSGLLAAKGAQRSAELGLDKLRTWEVIKSSSSPSNSAPNGGLGLPGRERAGSISSGGGSQRALSSERGGTVRIQSTTRHARGTSMADRSIMGDVAESPARDEEGPFVTPTSTGLVSDLNSPVAPTPPMAYRVARSRSLHASSSPTTGGEGSTSVSPPIPPPRRKRPESVQEGWGIQRFAGGEQGASPFEDATLSRRSTVDPHSNSMASSTSNPMASIRSGFHQLQQKTRPGLETARAKVEGKLMPGGYGKWGSESLTGGSVGVLRRKPSAGLSSSPQPAPRGAVRNGASSEASDEYEDADDVLSTDDDVRRNGWKPLKG